MDTTVHDLFGDDEDHELQARDFISRYEQGAIDQGYSADEAYDYFQRVVEHADLDTVQRAAEQAFARMEHGQRTQFGQLLQQQGLDRDVIEPGHDDPRHLAGMVSQMHRENPPGLATLFTGGGTGDTLTGLLDGGGEEPNSIRNPLGKVVLGGIAAFAMKEMLSRGTERQEPV